MNLACGPSRELFDFLQNYEHSERVYALCVDLSIQRRFNIPIKLSTYFPIALP